MFRNYGNYIKEYESYDAEFGLKAFTIPETYKSTDGKIRPKYTTYGVLSHDVEAGLKLTGYSKHELRHFQNKRFYNK